MFLKLFQNAPFQSSISHPNQEHFQNLSVVSKEVYNLSVVISFDFSQRCGAEKNLRQQGNFSNVENNHHASPLVNVARTPACVRSFFVVMIAMISDSFVPKCK